MKTLYDFIVKPVNERYNNKKSVNGKDLILNTTIEDHKYVSKKAVVVSTPTAFKTKIKVGDMVYIHHNVFRRYYDIKGNEKNSSKHFKEDMYFCSIGEIYMYNNKCNLNYCFVKPILNKSNLSVDKEREYFGILKYSNDSLEALGLKPGELVIFTPNSEFEFIIEGERLYCMKSNNIAVTHEYEGDEEENNPSWAKSY
tara:strand:+ start:1736 stop:2329 length:594 start_codon:yes stop_codon:yes gene_type:complete